MKKSGIIAVILLIAALAIGLGIGLSKKTNTIDTMEFNATQTAVISTSAGDITVELYGEATPKTVENFVKLASEGFYDDTRSHRIIENFMIQMGDPNTRGGSEENGPWGTGGPGYQFEDEIVEGLSNLPGTISMANAGPGTNGSQFFINVADNSFLDGKHSVFGKVIDGMDTAMELSQVATAAGDRPIEEVVIETITIK